MNNKRIYFYNVLNAFGIEQHHMIKQPHHLLKFNQKCHLNQLFHLP